MFSPNIDLIDPFLPDLQQIETIFQWMPSCGVVIDKNGNILDYNKRALDFFRIMGESDSQETSHIGGIVIDLPQAMGFISELLKGRELNGKKMLFRRKDNTIVCVEINACLFPKQKNLILIQFTETSQHNQELLAQIIQAFRVESLRLKPYLNKPGKELLEKINNNYVLEGILSNKATQNIQLEVVRDDRVTQLVGMFPELTNSELALCGFLSLKMSMDEIASVTDKTPNNLRVTFHRIVRKLGLSSGKELIKKLETIKE